jgi:beta-N-acetylhexosaminidase
MAISRIRNAAVLALCAGAAVVWPIGCGAGESAPDKPAAKEKPEATLPKRVDPLEDWTLQQQAGQLVMTKLDTASPAELEVIRKAHIGGVILFRYNYTGAGAVRSQVAKAQRAARGANPDGVGLLVSADQEGGTVRAFLDQPSEISAPTLGNRGVADSLREGRRAGRALRAMGVNMNLAPLADLVIGPKRVMAGRSFGSDVEQVAPRVAAYVTGLQDENVSAVPKHFPGFGASTENSDFGVAHVDRTRAEIHKHELEAFRPGLDTADAVMVSHGIYRGLGSTSPATLDAKIIDELLRKEMQYDRVAITDSLNAKGLRESWGKTVPQACAKAIASGIDIALVTGSMETAQLCARRIVGGVRSGTIPRERFDEAVARVLELKRRRGLLPDEPA